MGLLSESTNNSTAMELSGHSVRSKIIMEGAKAFSRNNQQIRDYDKVGKLIESKNTSLQTRGALTAMMVERTQQYMERSIEKLGEAVVQSSLGDLNKRVLDVVRIFYPNLIAHELVDIQPIDGIQGQIFTIRPKYVESGGGATAGHEIFGRSADQTVEKYASTRVSTVWELNAGTDSNKLNLAAGNKTVTSTGSANELGSVGTGTSEGVVQPGSLRLSKKEYFDSDDATRFRYIDIAYDNGIGSLVSLYDHSNTKNFLSSPGTIAYDTGIINFTLNDALGTNEEIQADYELDSQTKESLIRKVRFDLDMVRVEAQQYPLQAEYSVAAGLGLSSHLSIDIGPTLTELMAQYIKIERDRNLVAKIVENATPYTDLNFDCDRFRTLAAADGGDSDQLTSDSPREHTPVAISKRALYADFEIKVEEAANRIRNTMGRGGVDFVLTGSNANNVIMRCDSFVKSDIDNPIGPYVSGSLNDGKVSVVHNPGMDENTYVFGYKGYMPGDSATILAEFVPIYLTPVFESPDLVNRQGAMSMYDLFVNNPGYYASGKLSNYSA